MYREQLVRAWRQGVRRRVRADEPEHRRIQADDGNGQAVHRGIPQIAQQRIARRGRPTLVVGIRGAYHSTLIGALLDEGAPQIPDWSSNGRMVNGGWTAVMPGPDATDASPPVR